MDNRSTPRTHPSPRRCELLPRIAASRCTFWSYGAPAAGATLGMIVERSRVLMSGLLVGVSALDTIFFSARVQIRLSLVQSPRLHDRHTLLKVDILCQHQGHWSIRYAILRGAALPSRVKSPTSPEAVITAPLVQCRHGVAGRTAPWSLTLRLCDQLVLANCTAIISWSKLQSSRFSSHDN